jgi:hypothetical protein
MLKGTHLIGLSSLLLKIAKCEALAVHTSEARLLTQFNAVFYKEVGHRRVEEVDSSLLAC